MKSPFKFPDSYTKDDREIFFGREENYCELPGFASNIIPPLQGLYSWHQTRWTLSIAKIFRAFSAKNRLRYYVALKGLYIKERDNVLFKMNIMIISPVRA